MKRSLVVLACGSVLLCGCTPSASSTAGPATAVTPAGAQGPTSTSTTTAPETTAAPTPTSPTAAGPAVQVGAEGAGAFAWGKTFKPSAQAPAEWNKACGAWVSPNAKAPAIIAVPTEGAEKGEIMSLIVMAPGATTKAGVSVGSPWADVTTKVPKGQQIDGPDSKGWAVTEGHVRVVYLSWDGGKTVGSIEVQDSAQPLEASAKINPCA